MKARNDDNFFHLQDAGGSIISFISIRLCDDGKQSIQYKNYEELFFVGSFEEDPGLPLRLYIDRINKNFDEDFYNLIDKVGESHYKIVGNIVSCRCAVDFGPIEFDSAEEAENFVKELDPPDAIVAGCDAGLLMFRNGAVFERSSKRVFFNDFELGSVADVTPGMIKRDILDGMEELFDIEYDEVGFVSKLTNKIVA